MYYSLMFRSHTLKEFNYVVVFFKCFLRASKHF